MKLQAVMILLPLLLALQGASAASVLKLPAIYVFGDSTADVGNNNYLAGDDAKANFPHYGVDYPGHDATGRFSNGYNTIDFLAIHTGFKRSPQPYLSIVNGSHTLLRRGDRGVSFASAGSGILDTTGNRITFTQQVKYFAAHKLSMESRVGAKGALSVLSKSLFIISSGGNDVFAFFYASNGTATAADVEAFYAATVAKYAAHLRALYGLGARKLAVLNVPPIGCCPIARVIHPAGQCIDGLNAIVQGLNAKISDLLAELNRSEMKDVKYMVGSSYNVVMNIVADPAAAGFKNVSSACCGSGRLRAEVMCSQVTPFCSNRNDYLFWDRIHPSQAAAMIAGKLIYSGSSEYATPMNMEKLVLS